MKQRSKRIGFFGVLVLTIILCFSFLPNASISAKAIGKETHEEKVYSKYTVDDDFETDCILVTMDLQTSEVNKKYSKAFFKNIPTEIEDLTRLTGDISKKKYLNRDEFRQILKLTLPINTKEGVLKAVEEIQKIEGVLCAEPSGYDQADSLPIATQGTGYANQWGLKGGYGCKANDAWNITTGSEDVRVGVIDTGIYDHADLQDNLETGWDFVHNDNITTDGTEHGTHVAGIIGATGKIENGVIGVCPVVKLVPLQVLVDGTEKDFAIEAVVHAINWCINEDIGIINYSAGGDGESIGQKNAINNYYGLFVCSAGNGKKVSYMDGEIRIGYNVDNTPHYPSDYSKGQTISYRVISVGSIDINGQKAQSSNYGTDKVSIYAPGVSIWSTLPNDTYFWRSGTSMATPFVTGTAALMLSLNPAFSGMDLKKLILACCDYNTVTVHLNDSLSNTATQRVKLLNTYRSVINASLNNNKTIRLSIDTYTIIYDSFTANPYDSVSFLTLNSNLYSISQIRNAGFTKINLTVWFSVAEIYDGWQYIGICNGGGVNDSLISAQFFEHGEGVLDTSWQLHRFDFELDLSYFLNEQFAIRYSAAGAGRNDWKNEGVVVQAYYST